MELKSGKNSHDLTCHSYVPLAGDFLIRSLSNFNQSPDEGLQIEAEKLRGLYYTFNILEVF